MASKVVIKTRDRKNILKFIGLLRRQGIKVSKVFLFGSYAKGKATVDSDIDLAVVSPQFGRDAISEMMLLRRIAVTIDSHFEPVPLSPAGYNDHYSTLSDEIRRYGVAVG